MKVLGDALRTESDSQDLMEERDRLVGILGQVHNQLQATMNLLMLGVESYNRLVQDHVSKRDKKEPDHEPGA